MRHAILHVAFLVCSIAGCRAAPAPQASDAIVFLDESKSNDDSENIITPPVLPIIAHLENDPTTLRRDEKQLKQNFKDDSKRGGLSPKFGIDNGFGVSPTGDGGFTASFSHGSSGFGGHSQSGSHSLTVGGPSKGFQVSQSSSQASSFGGGQGFLGNSLAGSQSSSQSSSFSGNLNGVSSASSSAGSASLTGNAFGQGFSSSGANSQSSANSFGPHGISYAFGQGSGQGASFPNGQTISNGQSYSGSFGNGAVGQASGDGFSQHGNGFSGSVANGQSLASVNTGRGPLTSFGQSSGYGGNNYYHPGRRPGPISGGQGYSGSAITFPGPYTNRYPKYNFRPINVVTQTIQTGIDPRWRQGQNRRKPSAYDIIRIEI